MGNKRKLTYEFCKEVALKFNYLHELRTEDHSMYAKILEKKWFELFSHMIKSEYIILQNEGKKRCTICKEIKPLEGSFYFREDRKEYTSQCYDCTKKKKKNKKTKYELIQAHELAKDSLKKCTVCLEIKPFEDFGKSKKGLFGLMWNCRSCKSKQDKEYRDRPENKERLLKDKQQYYYKVKDEEWYRELCKQRNLNRDYKEEYRRVKENEFRNFKSNMRKITHETFARFDKEWAKRGTRSEELLGVDFFTVKEFIERQFIVGMTWENYGEVWHIDHTIPLDASNGDIEVLKILCNYQNLSPMFWKDNLNKSWRVPDICTLWKNPIVPYKEKNIVIEPKNKPHDGRYKLVINPGERYGNLTVIGDAEPFIGINGNKGRVITCQCDCGVIKDVSFKSIRTGNTTSCGCIRIERLKEFFANEKTLIFTDEEIKILTNYVLENKKGTRYTDEFINSFPGRNKQQIRAYLSNIRNGNAPLKVKTK